MDNDNLVTALSGQIQVSIGMIGTVRKPSIQPIVLARRWIQATTQREIRTMVHHSLSR